MQEKAKWKRKSFKQKASNCNKNRIKKEIKKAEKNKTSLNSDQITDFLVCQSNFIGCFAQNTLPNSITSFLLFLLLTLTRLI